MAVQKTNLSKMSFEDALEELENIVRDLGPVIVSWKIP